MNFARLTTRIGAHLLFTLLFFLGWAWLNIEVIATPAWVDVLFAGSVVIWLLSETRWVDPLIRSRNRGLLTILSWSTLSAALCVAVAWAVQGLVNFQAQTFIRDVLFPLAAAEELIVDLRDQVQARSYGLQSDEWGILARALGGLSVLALLVAMLTRLAWLSLWPHIALVLVQVRIALPTLRLRHRRIDQWFWRIGLVLAAVLMLIVWFGGRRTPPAAAFDWRNSIAGPALPLQVTDIVVDPRRGWIFAATDAGVFRSEDAGATWQPMNRVSTIRATFRHLALDPHIDRLYALEAVVGGGRVYQFDLGAPPDTAGWAFIGENGTTAAIQEAAAATGERVFGTGSLGRVTFIAPIPPAQGGPYTLLAGYADANIYRFEQEAGLAPVTGVIHRSSDGGASWEHLTVSPGDPIETITAAPDGSTYALSERGRILRSTDQGGTWTDVGRINRQNWGWERALYAGPDDDLLFLKMNGSLWRSADSGGNWTQVVLVSDAADSPIREPEAFHLTTLQDGTLLAGTNYGVYRSDDAGLTWEHHSAGLQTPHINIVAEDPQDGTLYAGTSAGVYRSNDGGLNWQAASNGLLGSRVLDFAVDPTSDTMLMLPERSGSIFNRRLPEALEKVVPLHRGNPVNTLSVATAPANGTNLRYLPAGGVLLADNFGEVHLSRDYGASWRKLLPDEVPVGWGFDPQRGRLYVATATTLLRSDDYGAGWTTVKEGANYTDVIVNEQNGALYLVDEGTLAWSTDAGQTWTTQGPVPPAAYRCTYVPDFGRERLYAACGTDNRGMVLYRSDDHGASWRELAELDTLGGETFVDSWIAPGRGAILGVAPWSGSLFASLGNRYFRSDDGGQTWEPTFTTFNVGWIERFEIVAEERAFYADCGEGIYRSTDDGRTWQPLNIGPGTAWIAATAYAERSATLYVAMSDGSIHRSTDNGATWQVTGIGLPTRVIYTLTVDPRNEDLYAGTANGIFRSADGGATWEDLDSSARFTHVTAVIIDPATGELFVRAGSSYNDFYQGVYRRDPDDAVFQPVRATYVLRNAPTLFLGDTYTGTAVQVGPGDPIWMPLQGAQFWHVLLPNTLMNRAALAAPNEAAARVFIPYQPVNALVGFTFEPALGQAPLGMLILQAIGLYAQQWFAEQRFWIIGLGSLAALGMGVNLYLRQLRPFGIPAWAPFAERGRAGRHARPAAVEAAFPEWKQQIRNQLAVYGDVRPVDLAKVPSLLRGVALQRFAEQYADDLAIVAEAHAIRLLSRGQVGAWNQAWHATRHLLEVRPELDANTLVFVDQLGEAVAAALGFTILSRNTFERVRAYQVEAPALRLNVPPRFPLLFVADPHPDASTVQMLVDAVDVVKESGFFALVVPLEPLNPSVDIPARLRQAIAQSAYVHDFIVLPHERLVDILMARRPIKLLTDAILTQVDLSVVSPFVISGPVRETMFFGREAEVKLLVENAARSDFAIVGNRRIGKTSLLSRVRSRLLAGGQVRLLMVDCQYVRDGDTFFKAFEMQTGIALHEATPLGFAATITALSEDGLPLVIMIDEVDALLLQEHATGEALVAIWRSLAQTDRCHFIFCGSTTLARRLDDAHSAFFNFAQKVALRYLEPATAQSLLLQPFETMGVQIDAIDRLGDELLSLTSGHPNLIQYVGKSLIDRINQRGERRVYAADIAALREQAAFTDYLLRVIWGEAGPLEKLITLTAPGESFQLYAIEAALRDVDVPLHDEALDNALEILQVYSVLVKQGRTYRFVPQAFFKILHETQEVKRLIAQEKRRLAGGESA